MKLAQMKKNQYYYETIRNEFRLELFHFPSLKNTIEIWGIIE